MDRLQKIIAASGLTSRRKAEEWILQDASALDGQVVNGAGGVKTAKGLIEADAKDRAQDVYWCHEQAGRRCCARSMISMHDPTNGCGFDDGCCSGCSRSAGWTTTRPAC